MKKSAPPQRAADLAEMAAFFDRLARAHSERITQDLESFTRQWERFSPGFLEVLAIARNSERKSASAYNIFRVLRVEHDEENTHSRFLADLLNPRGSHGQGHLFLKAFLDHCHEKQNSPPLSRDAFSMPWYVETEKGTQQGRIDIVIACPEAGYLVAIENKVFATEQERQIKRYHLWLESLSHGYAHRFLFFLTPDGRQPTTAGGCGCVALSYRGDVSQILRVTMDKLVAPHLRAIIDQYLEIVENLTPENEARHEHGQIHC